jgi:hypothetical protein
VRFAAALVLLPLVAWAQKVDMPSPYWYASYSGNQCQLKGYFDSYVDPTYVAGFESLPPGYDSTHLVVLNLSTDLSGEIILASASLSEPWRVPADEYLKFEGDRAERVLEDMARGQLWSLEHRNAQGHSRKQTIASLGARISARMFQACRDRARLPATSSYVGDYSYATANAGWQSEECELNALYSAAPWGASITLIGDRKGLLVKSYAGRDDPESVDFSSLHGPKASRNGRHRLPKESVGTLVESLVAGKAYLLPYAKGEAHQDVLVFGGGKGFTVPATMFRVCLEELGTPLQTTPGSREGP